MNHVPRIPNRSKCAAFGAVLAAAVAVSGCDDGADGTGGGGGGSNAGRGIKVQISGEDAGPDGFLFPTGSEVTLADGWEIKFKHVLVAVDHITISENPDKAPTDQSQTDEVVAQVDGPWVVDLAKEGTETGAGGEGKATLLTTIANQNKKANAAFENDRRYAFSYAAVVPSPGAQQVNLDTEAAGLVTEMAAKGYAVFYVGTATFKGATCNTSDPAYNFTAIPASFEFRIGFATPSSYINCQNESNEGQPFDGEEYQRGVAIPSNTDAVAQLTFHLEHPFFTDVQHDPSIRFDQFAAQLVGAAPGTVLTEDKLVGVDPTAVTDAAGADLPWRSCDGSDLPAGKVMSLAVGSVPVNPTGTPETALRDLKDYVYYVQSTQGHLNGGEGLCFVKRGYPSPP